MHIRLSLFIFFLLLIPAASDAATVTFDTVDTTQDPVILTGTSTESGATITNIEFQTNGTGGSWTGCTATDASYDSAAEGFSCNLGTLSDGSYTIYIRTTADTPLGFQATTSDPTASFDLPFGIAGDDTTVYVTGYCNGCGSLGGFALYTIAYDKTDGSYVWSTTTDPTSGSDSPTDIVSDNNNVYVTGSCAGCGSQGGKSLYTIAYDKTDGSYVWSTTTDPTIVDDRAAGIAQDTNNIYVTGDCTGCGALGDRALYTVVYNKSDGSLVWATTTDPTSGADYANDVAVDSNNVYVTSSCGGCGSIGGSAYYTIAYDKTDGSYVWSTTTDLTANGDDTYGIGQDANNVYVTGYCDGCGSLGGFALYTIAYDKTDGSYVWSTTTDPTSGNDFGSALFVDDNVYVSGPCSGCGHLGSAAFYTVVYDKTDGSYVWSTTTDPTSSVDQPTGIYVDASAVFVTGSCISCGPLGSYAFYTIVYDKATGNTYTSGTNTDNTAFTIDPPPSSSSQGTRVASRAKTIAPIEITVGTPTIESLTKKLNELRTQLNELLATTGGSGGGGSLVYLTDLTIGSGHPDVSRLQQYLVQRGYLTMPEGVSYGYFGPLTQAALAQFQQANNITPSVGYFGPITRAFLNQ